MDIIFEAVKWIVCASCTIFLFGFGATGIVEAYIRYRDYKDSRKE